MNNITGDYHYSQQEGRPLNESGTHPPSGSTITMVPPDYHPTSHPPGNPNSAKHEAQLKPVYENAKIFVGGLNVMFSNEDLQEYFQQFGPVVQIQAIKARGFGFITFKDENGVNACLKMRWHNIKGLSIDVKRAKYNTFVNNKQNVHEHKLFVSMLDPEVRSHDLHAYFESLNCRVINASVVLVRDQGKGLGFVNFKDGTDVQHALSFAKHEIFGSPIYVKEPTINSDPNKCKVFIGGLESSIDTPDLKKFFSAYGNVKDSIVCMDKHLRTSRGFGFITFATEEERQLAIEAQPIYIRDKKVEIKLALPKEEGTGHADSNKLSTSWVNPTGSKYSYPLHPGGEYDEEHEAVIESSEPKASRLWGEASSPSAFVSASGPQGGGAGHPPQQQPGKGWQPYKTGEEEYAQGMGQYQPTYPVAAVSRLRTAKDSYTPPAAAPPDFSSESSNGGQPSSGPLVDALLRKLVKVEDECKLLKKQMELNNAAIHRLKTVVFNDGNGGVQAD